MRGKLVILDVSDPVNPRLLGTYDTGLGVDSLFVDGNLAYVSGEGNHEGSFRIVDVSNPAQPVGLSVNGRWVQNIWSNGRRAYLADDTTGTSIRIMDVSQPSSPAALADFDTGAGVGFISGFSNQLYVVQSSPLGSSYRRLSIYDISTDTEPRLVGGLDLTGTLLRLEASGGYVYIANRYDGMAIVDVRNPSQPVLLGCCDTDGIAMALGVSGTHAFVADFYEGIQVVDISDPYHPVRVSTYDTGLTTRRVRVSGDRAYLVSGDTVPFRTDGYGSGALSRLEIIDVANPTEPALLGACSMPGLVGDLDVAGDVAYLGRTSDDHALLDIIDASQPAAPQQLSSTSWGGWDSYDRTGVRIAGHHAYVAAGRAGLQIVDVSNPTNPVKLSQCLNDSEPYAVGVTAGRAYLKTLQQLAVIDVANPVAPAQLGALSLEGTGLVEGTVQVQGDYAYCGLSFKGYLVIDVHDSTNPVAVGGYDTLGDVHELWSANQHLFLAEGWEGLSVFDTSDPVHPLPLGRVATCGEAYGVQVAGNYAYVADGGSGLAIISLPSESVTLVQPPASLKAALGDTATLNVRAYGSGPLSYQWYAGESGDVSHPIAGANGTSFTAPVSAETAPYWVRVSSSEGASDSQTAWVSPVPPVSVELLSLWPGYRRGSAVDVQVAGDLAYVAAGSVQIWSLTNLASPRLVGSYAPRDWPLESLAFSSNRLFLACGDKGLQILDVACPETPALLGIFTNGSANKVVVAGSVAYVVGDPLRILDVSDPSQPHQLASLTVAGTALDVQGQYAYLVDGDGNLQIFDVFDPEQPLQLASTQLFSAAPNAIRVAGNYAYVAEGQRRVNSVLRPGRLDVVNISDPRQPSLAGSVLTETNSDALAVDVLGAYAFVVEGSAGLRVVDVANPAAPSSVGGLSLGAWAQAVAASGQRAYVASDGGLHCIDISLPASPRQLNLVETSGYAQAVAGSGQQVFLADGDGGLKILEVSDPTRPTMAGVYREYAPNVAVKGRVAYVGGLILDVSDPTQIGLLGLLDAGDVFLAGDYAYSSGSTLSTFDVQNPAEPKLLGTFPISAGMWGTLGMAFAGQYAFLGQSWEGLQILDVSAPAALRQVGAYYTDYPVGDVAVRGSVGCVTFDLSTGAVNSGSPGLEVLELRDLCHPLRAATMFLPSANHVVLMGSHACITGDGLQVLDLGDPYQPVRVGAHQGGFETWRLQVVGDLAYVAAGEYGLAIYRLTPQLRLNPPVFESNGLRLSWVGGPGIRLQRTTSLTAPVWEDVPNSDGVSSLLLPPPNPSAFFRLVRP